MPEHILKVNEGQALLRLDVFLTQNLPDVPSRTFIKHLIDSGQVTVNQKKVKAHHKVALDDEIVVQLSDDVDVVDQVQPENIPLDILYEDSYLLVINKPAGMLVHPVHGCTTGTLVNALLYHCADLSDMNVAANSFDTQKTHLYRPGIVHRLDRDTSGLVVVAKDNYTHARLAKQFETRRVKKRYIALVSGNVAFDEGVIDAPLGRHPNHFDKRKVSFEESAKEAKTYYKVIKHFGTWATLMALNPQSGRTHQLRVHMAFLGHAILGDEKYGQKNSFPRMALHAQSIAFYHPHSKNYLEFSCVVPEEFYKPTFQYG